MLGKTRHDAGHLELVGLPSAPPVVPERTHLALSEHLCQLSERIGLARHVDIVAIPVGLPCTGDKNDEGKIRRRIHLECCPAAHRKGKGCWEGRALDGKIDGNLSLGWRRHLLLHRERAAP